jgi:hypothetical protein
LNNISREKGIGFDEAGPLFLANLYLIFIFALSTPYPDAV